MSSHIIPTGTAEGTLFLGPRIPNHVKQLSKLLPGITKPTFRALAKLIVLDFEGKDVTPEMYQSVIDASEDSTNINIVYGALYQLLKCAFSLPDTSLKQENFKQDLQELKLPVDCIEDLTNIVYGRRRLIIENNFLSSAPHLPKLETFKWRVDVTISTSSLSRVLEPSILMDITLGDGQRKVFEVYLSQFHRLRFAVATLLKEMENLEKRSILKL